MMRIPERSLEPQESFEERLARIEERENRRALEADARMDEIECSEPLTPEECKRAVQFCNELYDFAVVLAKAREMG